MRHQQSPRNDILPCQRRYYYLSHKYNRLYYLSTANKNEIHQLLTDDPVSLMGILWQMISYIFIVNEQKRKYIKGKLKLTMKTIDLFALLENDMNLKCSELQEDYKILINKFYRNLCEWFFIPSALWYNHPSYKSYEIIRIRTFDLTNGYSINYQKVCLAKQRLDKSDDKVTINKMSSKE